MDFYEMLSISPTSTNEEIKAAYKRLAKIHHPDKKTGNTEQFQKIHNAYNILINDSTRLKYNDMKNQSRFKLTNFLDDWFKSNFFFIRLNLSGSFANIIAQFSYSLIFFIISSSSFKFLRRLMATRL